MIRKSSPPPPDLRPGEDEGPWGVRARGLSKRFGGTQAVVGLDLDIPRGSFFGLLGPNGAGKSTTLAMATGLLRPDSGSVVVAGVDVWSDPVAAKRSIGVLPEHLHLFDRLTGAELLTYTGLLRGLPASVVDVRAAELLALLDLEDAADVLVVDYSTGMRKKVALGAALLHSPPVLFLDEPFEGVDPVSVRVIRELLEDCTRSGMTVVFSSHVLELVGRLCDRLGIMVKGRLQAVGTLDEVTTGRSLEDVFLSLVGADVAARGGLSWLRSSSA